MTRMSPFHVRFWESGNGVPEVKVNLDEDALERQFLAPYREGRPITVNGRTTPVERIARIKISYSDGDIAEIAKAIRQKDAQRPVVRIGPQPTLESRAAASARDVTDEYINGPPGKPTASGGPAPSVAVPPGLDRRSVFVVTGRDDAAYTALTDFLRALDLRIVEWEHAVAHRGVPSPYIGDVVEEGLRMAQAAVVLITPDDIVSLREDLLRDDDDDSERRPTGQARPNVFYEAGFADAIGRERTVIVEIGSSKSFSDIAGRHVVRYDGSASKRNTLLGRLRAAGLEPNSDGTAWLTAGDASLAIARAKQAVDDARDRATPSGS